MALKINQADLSRKARSSAPGMAQDGMMDGINKFMGNFNTTIENAGKLLGQYKDIKNKLTGNEEANNPAPQSINTPPPNPTPPPKKITKDAEFKEVDKKKRAEEIFKELHELVKPHTAKLNFVNGSMMLAWALKPDNKEKIIAEIEKRL